MRAGEAHAAGARRAHDAARARGEIDAAVPTGVVRAARPRRRADAAPRPARPAHGRLGGRDAARSDRRISATAAAAGHGRRRSASRRGAGRSVDPDGARHGRDGATQWHPRARPPDAPRSARVCPRLRASAHTDAEAVPVPRRGTERRTLRRSRSCRRLRRRILAAWRHARRAASASRRELGHLASAPSNASSTRASAGSARRPDRVDRAPGPVRSSRLGTARWPLARSAPRRRRGRPRLRARLDKPRRAVDRRLQIRAAPTGRRAADHEHDLAARLRRRVARRELGRRAAHDLLVQLGQLAAHRDRAVADRPARAPQRCAPTRRGDSKATTRLRRRRHRRQLARLARQEADEAPAVGGQRAGDERRERRARPRQDLDRAARRRRRPARARSPGRSPSGIPASETSATTAPLAHPRDQLGRPRALVVLVVARRASRADAVAVEQHPRAARVLAGDDVGVAQRAEHAQRDVLEVPDRRRADDQPAALTPLGGPRASSAVAGQRARRRACPHSSPKRAGTIAHDRRAPAAARAAEHDLARGLEQQVARRDRRRRRPRRRRGLKTLTRPTSPTPSAPADQRERVARRRVAVVRQLGDERAGDRRGPRPASRPSALSGSLARHAPPRAPSAAPGRVRLEAPAVGAAALARRAVLVDRPCGRAPPPRRWRRGRQPAVDDHPAADPGAERQQERVGRAARRAARATRRASRRSRRCRPAPGARGARA